MACLAVDLAVRFFFVIAVVIVAFVVISIVLTQLVR